MLRTGAPWRDLPERFGPWSTAWSRFRRWTAAGVWQRVLEELQREADRNGRLDWQTHFLAMLHLSAILLWLRPTGVVQGSFPLNGS